MKAVRITFVTLAALALIWGGLALIAWLSGALDDRIASLEPEDDPAGATEDPAVGAEPGDPEPAIDPDPTPGDPPAEGQPPEPGPENTEPGLTEPGGPVLPAPAEPAPPPAVTRRFRVCETPTDIAHSIDPLVTFGQLRPGGLPEAVVACADRFVVVTFQRRGDEVHAAVIAEASQTSTRNIPKHTGRAAIGDVTGDGRADIVLPFFFRASGGGSRGGRLALWSGREDGTFGPLRALPQHTYLAATLFEADGRPGLEIFALDRGRPWADEGGAVRVLRGGRSPSQIAQASASKWPGPPALLDLDLDGQLDAAIPGEDALHLHQNVASRRSTRTERAGHCRQAYAADLDEDGHPDLVVSTHHGLEYVLARVGLSFDGLAFESLVRTDDILNVAGHLDQDGDGTRELMVVRDQREGRGGRWSKGITFLDRAGSGSDATWTVRNGYWFFGHDVDESVHLEDEVLMAAVRRGAFVDLTVVIHPRWGDDPDPSNTLFDSDAQPEGLITLTVPPEATRTSVR